MLISICIPQHNRIDFLKISLKKIAEQDYQHVEIVISDDASSDNTEQEINELVNSYKFPIKYYRFAVNQGYDRNLRKSLEMATGVYCFILGNDDTLSDSGALKRLATFLKETDLPEVGFCNSADYFNPANITYRASKSMVIGSGVDVALRYYSSFSFVAGIIYKKKSFDTVNTNRFDGSIYTQIYLATLIIAKGGRLFTYADPLVLSNIRYNNNLANSYRDTLPKKREEFKKLDGGLPSFANVVFHALKDANPADTDNNYKIIKRIYLYTYPYWLIDYRKNKARVAALGLKDGLKLKSFKNLSELTRVQKLKLNTMHYMSSMVGLGFPIWMFELLKTRLYKIAKS